MIEGPYLILVHSACDWHYEQVGGLKKGKEI